MAPTPYFSRAVGILVTGVAATALTGCVTDVPNRLEFSDTESAKITEIVIGQGHGDVTVTTSATTETTIKRSVSYRGDQPGQTYRLVGTVLQIDTDCGDNCTVNYAIGAPAGVSVRGATGSGDIDLSGVSTVDVTVGSGDIRVSGATGDVKAASHSGNISVTDPTKAVRLVASSGDIQGHGLGRAAVDATAASGTIDLELTQAGPVTAHASSGDLSVRVPEGHFRISAHAGSGDARVNVPSEQGAPTALNLTTDSGDITVTRG